MDTPAIMALWVEDGVDLMQGEAPIVGRKTITAWIERLLANMPGKSARNVKFTAEACEMNEDCAAKS